MQGGKRIKMHNKRTINLSTARLTCHQSTSNAIKWHHRSLFARMASMKDWRNAAPLGHAERLGVSRGLLVEYLPGKVTPADLASCPSLRADLLAPEVRPGYVICGFSAVWVHTGWWPPEKMRELTLAHPTTARYPVVMRTRIPDAEVQYLANRPVTTLERTATDILKLGGTAWLGEAISACFHLFAAGLSLDKLLAQASRTPELRPSRHPQAHAFLQALPHYHKLAAGQAHMPAANRSSRAARRAVA